MLKTNLKRIATAALCAAMLITFTACQEDPEGSIVAHKDMDKLISQGAATDESRVDAEELISDAAKTETYRTTIENPNLNVTVSVDAQVDVPGVDKLSIYRVKQEPISQDFLDRVLAELCGDVAMYDGGVTRVQTKRDMEGDIQALRQSIAENDAHIKEQKNDPNIPEGEGFTDEELEEYAEQYRQEMQRQIDELQEQYERAPAELNFADYPTDYQIRPAQEIYELNPDNEFYQWIASLSRGEDDAILYAVSDGKDGRYRSIKVQNNADYSNKLEYNDSLARYWHSGVLVEDTPFKPFQRDMGGVDLDFDSYWQEKNVPAPVVIGNYYFTEEDSFAPVGSTDISFSQEEAQAKAGELLQRLGLTEFRFSEGDRFSEIVSVNDKNEFLYEVYYILRYNRDIDGVPLTQSSGTKFAIGQDDSNPNRKQLWPGESIEIRINDRGIVGFLYNAPIVITETVVEGTSLKTFDDVKGVFEQMAPVVLADTDYGFKAKVDRVRLSYSRISEKDSFDSGLVIPVWSFEGKAIAYYDGGYPAQEYNGTLLAINAIDGSVIDSNLGY